MMGKKKSDRETWGKSQQSLGAEARATAIKRLQEAHPDEWVRFHAEERESRGLPGESGVNGYPRLRLENEILRKRIAELEQAQ